MAGMNCVEIPLSVNGTPLTLNQLKQLFCGTPSVYPQWQTGIPCSGTDFVPRVQAFVEQFIGHMFQQTLQRDLFFGSWAEVGSKSEHSEDFVLKLTSPDAGADLSAYHTKVPAFLEAGLTGLAIFSEYQRQLPKECQFLLPFGLAMARTRSVQLLHFPPASTMTNLNYLCSDTNRRWESLLHYNKLEGVEQSLVEAVVDIVPLTTASAAAADFESMSKVFAEYSVSMLRAALHEVEFDRDDYQWYDRNEFTEERRTQPVIACGGAVCDWMNNCLGQSAAGVNTICELKLFGADGPVTPVLLVNHPNEFLNEMLSQEHPHSRVPAFNSEKLRQIMHMDLVSAGWQKQMSERPHLNPDHVLRDCTKHWNENAELVSEYTEHQITMFSRISRTDGVPVAN